MQMDNDIGFDIDLGLIIAQEHKCSLSNTPE